jgi:hypothetical protein
VSKCVVCGRSRVPLVYSVQGRLWTWPWGERFPTRRRTGHAAQHFAALPIGRRTTARCLLTADCTAAYEARRERQQARAKLPVDAVLRKPGKGRRGWCRWCGEAIYRVDKAGRVVQDMRRMWHEGREVHPDAEPEPRCVQEYNAQAFTFRDQVKQRDGGVCADCGRDCEAELAAWRASNPSRTWDDHEAGEWFDQDWAVREQLHTAWLAREPDGWQADHVVALEDGGEHSLANAQTLCKGCHVQKTGAENAARARRRRGDQDVHTVQERQTMHPVQ